MERKPVIKRKTFLTWFGVALLGAPVLFMLANGTGGPKPGLLSGIAIALGSALVVLGNIRT